MLSMKFSDGYKKWYKSKMFWVNLIALVSVLMQIYFGKVIQPEMQITILGVLNMVLRFITKEEIIW